MSNYRPNVAERPAVGQWYDHDIDYADSSDTDLNVFFYGLTLKVSSMLCVFMCVRKKKGER
jgi:hypothetical protein